MFLRQRVIASRIAAVALLALCAGFAPANAVTADPASPVCNIADLPDPSLIERDGKFAIRLSKPDVADADAIFSLNEIPDCGALVRVRHMSVERRARFLEAVPNVAARLLGAETGSLKFVREKNYNGFPLEIWTGGGIRYFLIIAQQMDAAPAFDAVRGTICIGHTKLPMASTWPSNVSHDDFKWTEAMERLAGVCMAETPKDTASKAVETALNRVNAELDRAAEGVAPLNEGNTEALTQSYGMARLNPRPASWPARKEPD